MTKTAAIKKAKENVDYYGSDSNWVLSVYDEDRNGWRESNFNSYWSVRSAASQVKLEMVLKMIGLNDYQIDSEIQDYGNGAYTTWTNAVWGW